MTGADHYYVEMFVKRLHVLVSKTRNHGGNTAEFIVTTKGGCPVFAPSEKWAHDSQNPSHTATLQIAESSGATPQSDLSG